MFLIITLILIIIILFRYRHLPFQDKLTDFYARHTSKSTLRKQHHRRILRTNRLNQLKARRRRLWVQTVQAILFGISLLGSFIWIAPLSVDRVLTHNATWIVLSVIFMMLILAGGPIYIGIRHYGHVKLLKKHYPKTVKRSHIKSSDLFFGTVKHPIEFCLNYWEITVNVLAVLVSIMLMFIGIDQESLIWMLVTWLSDILYIID